MRDAQICFSSLSSQLPQGTQPVVIKKKKFGIIAYFTENTAVPDTKITVGDQRRTYVFM